MTPPAPHAPAGAMAGRVPGRRHLLPNHPTALASVAAVVGLTALPAPATAQLTLKPDDQWRYAITAGATSASGNSDSLALNLSAEAGVQNLRRKWLFHGRGVYGRSDDITSTHNAGLGFQGNRELGGAWFTFGTADWFRDRLVNLSTRLTVSGGPGYHLFKEEIAFWDVFAGLGYTYERYAAASEVGDRVRERYGRAEALIGTESLLQLTGTTSWKQRFVIHPNLDKSGEYRASFDTSLSVAMTRQLAVTASFSARRNSDPGTGLRKNDYLIVTGVTFKSP